jgi:thymidylate kinase
MLIGFIGLPNSGKTTIASKMFSHLKENAANSELLVEQARLYIAEKRTNYKDKVELSDEDQLQIAARQKKLEKTMVTGTDPATYIISDSSVQNSAIYVSKDLYDNPDYIQKILFDGLRYDLIFYCHPFELQNFIKDSNRIHSLEDIEKLRDRANDLLDRLKKSGCNVKEVMGTFSLENRFKTSMYTLTEEYTRFCSKLSYD